jgi:hypothetical protein
MRELGRIRTGVQQEYTDKGGKKRRRPAKLETFRLTSASRDLLEAAATTYGGRVAPWPEQNEFQLVTDVDALDIVVPPGQAMSQWYELWSGGGCQRRCDGVTNVLADAPCACPADAELRVELAAKGEACKPTTRLNVILPAIPDLGVWRLESHGFYAAVELAGTAEFLERATAQGRLLPARLRLDRREIKRPGEATRQFTVPVIELPQTRIGELVDTGAGELAPGNGHAQLIAGAAGPAPAGGRRQRVERPPIGSSPELPAEPDFHKPTAPFGAEPERVAGWVVDEAPPPPGDLSFDAPGPGTQSTVDADAVVAKDEGLSVEQFMRLVGGTDGVTNEIVVAAAHELFPGIKNLSSLTDAARGALWDAITKRMGQPA